MDAGPDLLPGQDPLEPRSTLNQEEQKLVDTKVHSTTLVAPGYDMPDTLPTGDVLALLAEIRDALTVPHAAAGYQTERGWLFADRASAVDGVLANILQGRVDGDNITARWWAEHLRSRVADFPAIYPTLDRVKQAAAVPQTVDMDEQAGVVPADADPYALIMHLERDPHWLRSATVGDGDGEIHIYRRVNGAPLPGLDVEVPANDDDPQWSALRCAEAARTINAIALGRDTAVAR